MQEKWLNLHKGDQERSPSGEREDRMVLGVASPWTEFVISLRGCGPGELAPGEDHIP